jgi:peroxiredoxin family protein
MSNRISVMVISGTIERLQMAAMVASVGAVSGNEVTVFLSMNALPFFRKGANTPAPAEGEMGKLLVAKKAPPFMQLFESAVELGDAKIFPCSMAMDVFGYEQKDVVPFLGEPLGLTKFLDDASEGQIWSF